MPRKKENTKKYYPIFWNLEGKRCLVVGGGSVAARKVKDLLEAGADVWLVSKTLCHALKSAICKGEINYIGEEYRSEHIENACLVIGATNDNALNKLIAADAQKRRVPFNIVDVPELCDFIVPASIKRGALTIAVSTGGASPALAKKIREELAAAYGEEYTLLLEVLREVRQAVLAQGRKAPENKKMFTALVNSPLIKALRDNDRSLARAIIKEITGETVRL